MDDFDTDSFIKEIEKRPALWDNSSVDYSNRILKKKCWRDIVSIFGGKTLTILEKTKLNTIVQKKWKGIRGCYTREIKRKKELQSGYGTGARKSEYMYFQQLHFLENVVGAREDLDGNSQDNDLIPQCSIKKYKRKAVNSDNDYDTLIVRNNFTEKNTNYNTLEQDEDRMFLLSLVGTLKKVPQEKKMGTKIKIMSLLEESTRYTHDKTDSSTDVWLKEEQYCLPGRRNHMASVSPVSHAVSSVTNYSFEEDVDKKCDISFALK